MCAPLDLLAQLLELGTLLGRLCLLCLEPQQLGALQQLARVVFVFVLGLRCRRVGSSSRRGGRSGGRRSCRARALLLLLARPASLASAATAIAPVAGSVGVNVALPTRDGSGGAVLLCTALVQRLPPTLELRIARHVGAEPRLLSVDGRFSIKGRSEMRHQSIVVVTMARQGGARSPVSAWLPFWLSCVLRVCVSIIAGSTRVSLSRPRGVSVSKILLRPERGPACAVGAAQQQRKEWCFSYSYRPLST